MNASPKKQIHPLVVWAVVQLVWRCWVGADGACGTRGRAGTARAGQGGLRL